MKTNKVVELGGMMVAALGLGIAVYAVFQVDWDADSDNAAMSDQAALSLFLGLLLLLIGLLAFITSRAMNRRFSAAHQNPSQAIEDVLEIKRSVQTAWHDPAVGSATGIFAFYGLLGMFWGFAIDSPQPLPRNEIWQILAAGGPHALILAVALFVGFRRGTFLLLTPMKFLIMATLGILAPLAFFWITSR